MGYTHHFSYQPEAEPFRDIWKQPRDDTHVIVTAMRDGGVALAGFLGFGDPVAEGDVIAFNGRTPLDHETLLLSLSPDLQKVLPHATTRFTRGSCKTDRKPYDLAVTAVLLRAHLLVPDHIALDSNGTWDDDWRPQRQHFRERGHRQLTGRLFPMGHHLIAYLAPPPEGRGGTGAPRRTPVNWCGASDDCPISDDSRPPTLCGCSNTLCVDSSFQKGIHMGVSRRILAVSVAALTAGGAFTAASPTDAALVAGAFTLPVSAAQAVPQVSAARAVAQPERVTTAARLWCYDAYWGWYLCAWGLIS